MAVLTGMLSCFHRPRLGLLSAGLLLLTAACGGDTPDAPAGSSAGSGGSGSGDGGRGGSSSVGNPPDPGPAAPQKVDLLFMIDNSISMTDKQEVLALAVPELLGRLIDPICIDALGAPQPPPAAGADCPAGQHRQFGPVDDLHVGFISSSLGDMGANVACPGEGALRYSEDRVDRGHLIGSRARGQATGGNAQGFLEWRAADGDPSQLSASAQQMLRAVGDDGCGWEMSLESWYRFLVDPMPYRDLVRVPCPDGSSSAANCVQRETLDGRIVLDEVLLAQRAAFLRPDSLVLIVMLSDENDCSMQVGGTNWLPLGIDDTRPMFRGTSACATDPNSKCCYMCSLPPPEGCSPDPICAEDVQNQVLADRLPRAQDGINLRCFDQQRRFGTDFLYPTARYVNALTQPTLCWNARDLSTAGCASEDLRDNPLFAGGRSPSRVLLAGVVGVPWQSLATEVDAAGRPLAPGQLRFKNAAELGRDGTWAQILGSPGVRWQPATETSPERPSVPPTPPTLPQMIESPVARAGVMTANPMNGREYDTAIPSRPDIPDDLEYACLVPLTQPIDCSLRDPNVDNCECFDGDNDKPLCEQTPGVSAPGTLQYWAHAYPGLRHLQVLKDYGDNAVVSSICPRGMSDPSRGDFGFRPALTTLLERMQTLSGR